MRFGESGGKVKSHHRSGKLFLDARHNRCGQVVAAELLGGVKTPEAQLARASDQVGRFVGGQFPLSAGGSAREHSGLQGQELTDYKFRTQSTIMFCSSVSSIIIPDGAMFAPIIVIPS
jgi:hypothetical protein